MTSSNSYIGDAGDAAYEQRVMEVYDALPDTGWVLASWLGEQLGGDRYEMAAKLRELRKRGLVTYDRVRGQWSRS